jgi:hypothetical protein
VASSFRFKYEPSSEQEYTEISSKYIGLLDVEIAITRAKNKMHDSMEKECTKLGMSFLEQQLKYPIGGKKKMMYNFLLAQLRLLKDQRYDETDFETSLRYIGPLVEESHANLLEARERKHRDYF